ncbi:MFS transporter [Kribbella turkmenica]|uniref:MFS transporter n=1 Tax=Kribbella turkmenica TaxID=2530375 RepID=A0A4R4WWU1_9ACTN|nr:MFS transporter [Kribbella turkmenica]TDD22178.1 MFS transporter [Kribbella turkmenica]
MSPRHWLRRAALPRYFVAASLARAADSGAAVGLVLLAVDHSELRHPEAVGGLLAAGLTAPHLLGPVVAKRLDQARDSRRYLFAAFMLFGCALAAAAFLLGRVPLPFVVLMTVVAGTCGPVLTGGISSRVADLTGPDQRARRRGEGLDVLSYSTAAICGPAGVAALAAATNPLTALAVLGAAAVLAAFLALTLPPSTADDGNPKVAASVRSVLTMLIRNGPLRRVNYATMFTAISNGSLPVVAVILAVHLTGRATGGATMMAFLGVGSLAGAVLLTLFPLRGEPDRLTTRYVALVGIATALCALPTNYPLALLAFAFVGFANAPFGTATFAARSEYAPPAARTQVFVTMASLKIAAASAGSALAGVLTSLGPRGLPLAAAAVVVLAALGTTVDRRRTTR